MKKAIINSLPKAGTNLLSKCLDLFGYTGGKGSIHAGLVLQETMKAKYFRILYRSMKQGYIIGIDMPIEINKKYVDNILLNLKDNSYCTAHVGYTDDILCKVLGLGIQPLVVIRDPRAVLLSSAHYINKNKKHALNKTISKMNEMDTYKMLLCGSSNNNITVQSLKTRCKALEPWINSKNVMCIRFEDIVGDKGGGSIDKQKSTLTELCEHLGATKEKIDYVAKNLFGPGKHTFRKGKINSWQEELPPEIINLVNEDLKDILSSWGYR